MRLARWLILLVLTAILGVLAFAGVLYLTRGTPVTTVRAFGDPQGPPAIRDPLFLRTLELQTGADVEPGHNVEVLSNGNGTFPRLWSDLRGARRTLTVQLFWVLPGALADSLKAVLSERARAGVRVHFLFDAWGSGDLPDEYMEELRRAGVRIARFRPVKWYELHKTQHRSHARLIVIDGRLAYTGGFGIEDRWQGDGRRSQQWRDTNVRFTGPAVGQAQAAFAAGWAEATGELLTGEAFFPAAPPPGPGQVAAGLLHTRPTSGSTAAERFYALSIAAARKRLYIANAYFVPDDDARRMLVAAARRGVDVRILVPGEKTDVWLTRYAGRAHYEELLEGGVRVYEYGPTMMHAKTLVADSRYVVIGSMNLDNRSLALNDESNLLVFDDGVARTLEASFADDLRFARELALPAFRRRPPWERTKEWLAGTLSRFL